MKDEGTHWTWRWKCPGCASVFRGVGDRTAKHAAEARIREHLLKEGPAERRAS